MHFIYEQNITLQEIVKSVIKNVYHNMFLSDTLKHKTTQTESNDFKACNL